MNPITRLQSGLALLRPYDFAMRVARCPYCGPSLFVRLRSGPIGVRCVRCAASAIHLAIGWALADHVSHLAECDACELSARGPLTEHLRRNARSAATSEYFADAIPGISRDGIRCEDVQQLTYADASFDVVTHTEVLEHVPDDARALAELFRVLRPGGIMIFTVPMHEGHDTVERARLVGGCVEHLIEPAYHFDPMRRQRILAFRDYGQDILVRLSRVGFTGPRKVDLRDRVPWIDDCPVIVVNKPSENA